MMTMIQVNPKPDELDEPEDVGAEEEDVLEESPNTVTVSPPPSVMNISFFPES
jgi:hypothetical protein